VTGRQVGETMKFEILRKGRRRSPSITLKPPADLVHRPSYDRRPSYLFVGGLVFTPLSHDYMAHWEGEEQDPGFRTLAQFFTRTPKRKEVVVMSHVYAHELNVGYHTYRNMIVERVNGRRIGALRDVLRALAKPVGRFHVFELANAADGPLYSRLVLEAARTPAVTLELMQRYDIPRDRSTDLM
jgi:PDZ domain